MAEKYLGESIGKLGFGFMRLPRKDGVFDTEQIGRMVDHFMDAGFTYFDTAYVYEGSEDALRKSLVERYPRESFQIATKLNLMLAKTPEELPGFFETSKKRLGVSSVDFYLLHGLGGPSIAKAEELKAWDYMKSLKASGEASHIGLSFHGTPEELDDIFQKHPEAEFVQLQINYLDWDSERVQSRRVYETARRHGKPVTIMEPVKGGLLGSEASPAAERFRAHDPDASPASWALRYAAQLEGIITVLSGMSAFEQVEDNVATFKNMRTLTDIERGIIREAADILNSIPRVPCTSCNYCAPNCPQKIVIPALMGLYSDYLVHRTAPALLHGYGFATRAGGKAGDCIACHVCEEHCPQHIGIADIVAKLSALVDG
ncbi:MAG: aldo/keto reductase [Oscillospiraceae bacterium]|jgi:predicted aldo/keto reductase-like oxidoreductase|nr:aldo/keto reductase [Oscillospiraceae bacterium]